MMHLRTCALLAVVVATVAVPSSKPANHKHHTLAAETAATAARCSSTVFPDCMADSCCNWCGLYFNTTIGFCMPMVPKPIPSLVCARDPPTCADMTSISSCANSGPCKWVPTGPPTSTKGLCVYDWDRCHAPASAVSVVKPIRSVPAPVAVHPAAPAKPRLTCNMTTAGECDARACCQWCGPAVGAGFCMPVIEWPTPALTCSKAGTTCSAVADSAACDASPMCSWHPFGPPGVPGPGICTFDTLKCSAE